MAAPRRIAVEDARRRVQSGDAILVCAYPRDKWREFNLEGSISVDDLPGRLPALGKDAEIIFYCA